MDNTTYLVTQVEPRSGGEQRRRVHLWLEFLDHYHPNCARVIRQLAEEREALACDRRVDLTDEGITNMRTEPLAGNARRLTWASTVPGMFRVYRGLGGFGRRLLAVTQERNLTIFCGCLEDGASYEVFREVDRYERPEA